MQIHYFIDQPFVKHNILDWNMSCSHSTGHWTDLFIFDGEKEAEGVALHRGVRLHNNNMTLIWDITL